MYPLQTITQKIACMINLHSILWGCGIFHLRDEAFEDVQICVKHVLPFTGVPFQI